MAPLPTRLLDGLFDVRIVTNVTLVVWTADTALVFAHHRVLLAMEGQL